ncbi:uncharacterized protein PAC_00016 [Phialocephala subalpina]|uniref:Uncharacterized protein n=1 Tax=Phialocephala subalpina TaxID=576137 RepID=A0A1L7WBJ1_9HELO|nr:uncharacterized protein PAC_00016 [Phialocephala subalpina]
MLRKIAKRTIPNLTSPHCDWTAYFDPMENDGISFYSHEHACSLGTTFRSVPDPTSSQSNDTVLGILNLKLEASCTASAGQAGSRMFLVDSTIARKNKSSGIPNRAPEESKFPTITYIGYFRRAMHYLDARRRLGRF